MFDKNIAERNNNDWLPTSCNFCPRACGVNRAAGERGVCGAGSHMQVARAALHFWEEPPISGTSGSGTVFFTHCSLQCVYCQNYEISMFCEDDKKAQGKQVQDKHEEEKQVQSKHEQDKHEQGESEQSKHQPQKNKRAFEIDSDAACEKNSITPEVLANIFLDLQDQGAMNINLVSPTHHLRAIVCAIKQAKAAGLCLPVVWNTSGYETPEVIYALRGVVDVYLTDFKYADAGLAKNLSGASDYPQVALCALREMVQQTGAPKFDEFNGSARITSGVVVRHLILPAHVRNSKRVLDLLLGVWKMAELAALPNNADAEDCCETEGLHSCASNAKNDSTVKKFPPKKSRPQKEELKQEHKKSNPPFLLSIMNQYTPVIASAKTSIQRNAAQKYPELLRKVTDAEYEQVLDYADALGFDDYFWQDGETAKESFIPEFDTSDVQ